MDNEFRISIKTQCKSGRRVILPCAGFGRRMALDGMSKELVIDPLSGKRLIDQTLELVKVYQPLVVVRRQKSDLLKHLNEHWPNVEVCIVEETREWPDTILKCAVDWCDHNVVVLPDTKFAPHSVLQRMFEGLENKYEIVFATFPVDDPRTWGVVQINNNLLKGCEKPQRHTTEAAWGIFGFRKQCGESLLKKMLTSTLTHEWYELELAAKSYDLCDFIDLTRPSGVSCK